MLRQAIIIAWLVGTAGVTGAADETGRVLTPVRAYALGVRELGEFLEHHRLSTDDAMRLRVGRVGRRLVPFADRPHLAYDFLVVEGDDLQAYSFPGGGVGLTEGLVRLFRDDDDALAMMIAHEIAHAAQRHHETLLAPDLATRETRRLAEIEADRFGALYAVRAGFRFSASYEALSDVLEATSGPTSDEAHPEFSERIELLRGFRTELERALAGFDRGREALRHGEFDEAINFFRVFLAQYPQSVAGQVNLGGSHLARVRRDSGTPHDLAEPLPILPEPGVTIRGGGIDVNELETAMLHFRRALELDDRELTARLGLAYALIRVEEFDEAERLLRDGLVDRPESGELSLALGNVFYAASRYEEARETYAAALADRSDWDDLRRNLEMCEARLAAVNASRPPR